MKNQTGITQLEKDLVDGLKALRVDTHSMVAIMVMLQTEEQELEMLRQMVMEVDMDLF